MTKRHVQYLFYTAANVLKDAAAAYPDLEGDFCRDVERLVHLSEVSGAHAFCVDLPNAAKHLERCLDSGTYVPSGIPVTKPVSHGNMSTEGIAVPKFLRGLYLRVFEADGKLKENCDVEAIFFLRQVLLAGKRVKLQCSDDDVRQAVERFVVIDNQLEPAGPQWTNQVCANGLTEFALSGFWATERHRERLGGAVTLPRWGGDERERQDFLWNLDCVSRFLCRELGAYSASDWRFRHGPGTIADGSRWSNKYVWHNWSDRLESEFPIADSGYYSYCSWANDVTHRVIGSCDPASRLMDVPKTLTKPRLIAAEPREHQWCQQNIWHYLRVRTHKSRFLRRFVDFGDQTRNQQLCVRGSKDGTLITLDLSDASDCVSCWAVDNLLGWQPSLLRALRATRTRQVKIGRTLLGQDADKTMELRKFATMGSSCTFPVETLLFTAITLAACYTVRYGRAPVGHDGRTLPSFGAQLEEFEGSVTVFGDDIIAPKESQELLCRGLEYLYFKVNVDKSFWTGKFRESCGVDAYNGHIVTPAYVRTPYDGTPESLLASAELCNHLYKRWLLNTAAYVESTLPAASLPLVPIGSGQLGLQSFVAPTTAGPFKARWNKVLQRREIRVPTISGEAPRNPVNDDTALLQFFTEAPVPHEMWKGGVTQRPVLRKKYSWVDEQNFIACPSKT